jgi:DNA-binding IclR family transcriptional regulator
MGKILLAHLPEREQRDLITEMTRTRRGPNTIVGKQALKEELASVLEEGLAINDRELVAELHAISAPVRNEAREVIAAIGISAPVSTIALDDLVEHLGPHLVSTADRVSARLGYRRDDER